MIILKNRTYDWLKDWTMVFIPGSMAIFYVASTIWNFKNVDDALGYMSMIMLAFGLILRNSSKHYEHDGLLRVYSEDEKTIFSLELNGDPDALEERDVVSFRVESQGKQLL